MIKLKIIKIKNNIMPEIWRLIFGYCRLKNILEFREISNDAYEAVDDNFLVSILERDYIDYRIKIITSDKYKKPEYVELNNQSVIEVDKKNVFSIAQRFAMNHFIKNIEFSQFFDEYLYVDDKIIDILGRVIGKVPNAELLNGGTCLIKNDGSKSVRFQRNGLVDKNYDCKIGDGYNVFGDNFILENDKLFNIDTSPTWYGTCRLIDKNNIYSYDKFQIISYDEHQGIKIKDLKITYTSYQRCYVSRNKLIIIADDLLHIIDVNTGKILCKFIVAEYDNFWNSDHYLSYIVGIINTTGDNYIIACDDGRMFSLNTSKKKSGILNYAIKYFKVLKKQIRGIFRYGKGKIIVECVGTKQNKKCIYMIDSQSIFS